MSDEETVTDEQSVAEAVAPSWSLAEGIGGEGDAPDWFKADKYATVSDQAKGYKELEGKLGAFTGAPESYEFALSEQLTESGAELDAESPLITNFITMAKEANMSQDMANSLVNMFVESQHADGQISQEAETTRVAEEMKLLGDNATQRVNNIDNWAKANLTPEQAEGLNDAATTAAGVQAIEALIAKSRNSPMQTDNVNEAGAVDMAELQALQFAKDDQGNRRMATDPVYRKMVQEKYAQSMPGENIITVG